MSSFRHALGLVTSRIRRVMCQQRPAGVPGKRKASSIAHRRAWQLVVLALAPAFIYSAAQAQATDTTPPTGSLTINGHASYTRSTAVTLNLSATDAVGVAGYYVYLSNGWVTVPSTPTYNGSVPYTLSSGDGTKYASIWYDDAAGNVSAMAAASIVLDQPPPPDGIVTATAGSGQVTLDWSGFADASSGLAAYNLVYSTSGSPATSCTTGTLLLSGSATS